MSKKLFLVTTVHIVLVLIIITIAVLSGVSPTEMLDAVGDDACDDGIRPAVCLEAGTYPLFLLEETKIVSSPNVWAYTLFWVDADHNGAFEQYFIDNTDWYEMNRVDSACTLEVTRKYIFHINETCR